MSSRRLLIALILLLAGPTPSPAADNGSTISQLPDSLAQWYKPINKRQVWLHTMFALRRERQAIEEYVDLRDKARVKQWSIKFVRHFRRLPEMVPEWADEVELDQATRLENAAEAGDLPTVSSSLSRLSRNCRSCHREYRSLAALKFRSPDFSRQNVPDGQGGTLSYSEQMNSLSRNINRIKIASTDDRWDAALQASHALRRELQRLGESCNDCHKDKPPRERILGSSSQEILGELEQALGRQQAKLTGKKLGEAAVTICARCHSVHRTLSSIRSQLFP